MTSRERLLTVLSGKIPDCVPVSPDFSNMIPAKLTGKPFWDLYLYNDPPIWEAYIECAKRFNIDALMDGYFPLTFPEEMKGLPEWEQAIVQQNEEMIITQAFYRESGHYRWSPVVTVYPRYNPPARNIAPEKLGLPTIPKNWRPVEGVKPVDKGPKGLKRVKELMGDHGLVGVNISGTIVLDSEEKIFDFYDHPEKYEHWAEEHLIAGETRFRRIMEMDVKPDFLSTGGSGTLVFQSLDIVRQFALPGVKKVLELAASVGMPTHLHSCGPEKELVKLFSEETALTVIDPLERPPMGDCDLAELKRLYGDKIVLKGNLHTSDVMLSKNPDLVIAAAKEAIDAAAEGGKFILSTGDQCGRDTPFENLEVMVEVARSYGKYR